MSATMPLSEKFSLQYFKSISFCSSSDSSIGKAKLISFAYLLFLAFSIASTSFHNLFLSLAHSGAFSGTKINVSGLTLLLYKYLLPSFSEYNSCPDL